MKTEEEIMQEMLKPLTFIVLANARRIANASESYKLKYEVLLGQIREELQATEELEASTLNCGGLTLSLAHIEGYKQALIDVLSWVQE